MSFQNAGQRRPSFGSRGGNSRGGGFRGGYGRGGQRRFGGPKPSIIQHSKYINKAKALQEMDAPEIKNTFADFNLHSQLAQNIAQHGYVTPTPIQDQTMPAALEGRDIVGLANTGTGKTAAFLIPILNKIANNNDEGALIIVPTRELASQVRDECIAFARRLPVGVVLCVGGMNIVPQIHALAKNPHIIIGTPGRLKDLIDRRSLNMNMFTTIVLDEVDRMLDIGFRKEIQYLISLLPEQRHSMCFSATITPEVEQVMRAFLQNPVKVSVKVTETNEHIEQDVVRVPAGGNKIETLIELLSQEEFARVIVFGRTKHGINKLEDVLSARGLSVTSIHGNKTQGARQRALDIFKRGRAKALLATDVAARGLDIEGVTHVINYDEPNTYEEYVHRIGRTGRAGNRGKALTFVM